jgi:hypothetical protein
MKNPSQCPQSILKQKHIFFFGKKNTNAFGDVRFRSLDFGAAGILLFNCIFNQVTMIPHRYPQFLRHYLALHVQPNKTIKKCEKNASCGFINDSSYERASIVDRQYHFVTYRRRRGRLRVLYRSVSWRCRRKIGRGAYLPSRSLQSSPTEYENGISMVQRVLNTIHFT